MHQPFYKDLVTKEYILPWVRLHAIKDYWDMVEVLKNFPNAKANFNLVPSLLLQIEDYVANGAMDKALEISVKDPQDLSLEERTYMLQNFFMANWDTMVKPYPRYLDLLYKRGRYVSISEMKKVAAHFSARQLMDLQVWFNLTWFGPIYKTHDEVVNGLIKKGKHFSAEDKAALISKQKEIMAKVIPSYKEAEDRGQVELSTSPFYHPILPLLCDSFAAREAIHDIPVPSVAFRHPEDAQAQIKLAIDYHTGKFGKPPRGMWPSEGSVSEQIIPLMAAAGIKWAATDEGILARSLYKMESQSRNLTAEELYQPYAVERDGKSVSFVFRNHFLSDQVGFVYHRWNARDSVNDFMHHLHNIRISLPDDGKNYLVTVILDGENAWEYYPEGGKYFFDEFYGRLSNDPMVRMVKIGDHIEENPPQKKLGRVFAGSWIDNNFRIWIGHEEDNTAWSYLREARQALFSLDATAHPTALQELYVAEGSDWWWWYGDDHSSENDAAFDALFRKHLKNIYSLIGKEPPRVLDLPIKKAKLIRPVKEPAYIINPVLDGKVTDYFEWLPAGHFDLSKIRGAMHQSETALSDVYYGFSLTDLYVRLDLNFNPVDEEARDFSYSILTFSPEHHKAEISFSSTTGHFAFDLIKPDGNVALSTFAVGKIVEAGIPFAALGAGPGGKIEFAVVVSRAGQEIERWPRDGAITVNLPTEDFELDHWSV
jgi:alpha-amylase/alpha-mannosidase (GH57 family)